ncbi:MAG TPA: nicotinate-nucleotide--dimethylbenzimidazole phosphoribosyltransferase [Xanthobacteraceae bacterium]|nr:nicotinate-nucleotide--dimethylbenzimidazole phosphoribosyltransferase [Xanthobacteraceae bacterium]
MTAFASFADLRAACLDLPGGHPAASAAVAQREDFLTKPPKSLGRLEELTAFLAHWQGHAPPRLERVDILVFAGNHGVTAQGVSAYPAEVTAQMVANFASGGAAINQLARTAGANLRVIPLDLDAPTADFTAAPALGEREFLAAVAAGYDAVAADADLVVLGEMGIGNTTAASAIAAALFGGSAGRWVGRGTGVDDAGILRKRGAIDRALDRHAVLLGDPLKIAAAFGGRELAAILGAALAARRQNIPVLLDGFVCTAAVAPLHQLRTDTLAHALAGHVSAEAGHRMLLDELGLKPLVDLNMRLGEASGAAVALLILRAALACHTGMATFAEAGVSDKPAEEGTEREAG